MDWREFIREELAKIIIAFIVVPILIFFRRFPEKLVEEYRKRRAMESVNRGKQIMYTISDLTNEIAPIYVHIIRYVYNGGPQKMTIQYEEPGHQCSTCTDDCVNKGLIKRLQPAWIEQHVSRDWAAVVEETLNRKGKVNTTDNTKFGNLSKQIWKDSNIVLYKECLIKFTSKGFYALGVCFCPKAIHTNQMDAKIWTVARKLEKYL